MSIFHLIWVIKIVGFFILLLSVRGILSKLLVSLHGLQPHSSRQVSDFIPGVCQFSRFCRAPVYQFTVMPTCADYLELIRDQESCRWSQEEWKQPLLPHQRTTSSKMQLCSVSRAMHAAIWRDKTFVDSSRSCGSPVESNANLQAHRQSEQRRESEERSPGKTKSTNVSFRVTKSTSSWLSSYFLLFIRQRARTYYEPYWGRHLLPPATLVGSVFYRATTD